MRRLLSCTLLAAAGCGQAAPPIAPVAAAVGEALPGLTATERTRFRDGETLFNHVFTPEEGLGPLFNENQCSACHTSPATGGTGDQLLVRGTRFIPPDECDALTADGGENVRAHATPRLAALGVTRQPFPPSATERGEFTASFLFGLGLVEAIPDAAIVGRADPDDRDGDGISGRPGRDHAGRLGRFGRKADAATLGDFIDSALRFEMGLTTTTHPDEPVVGGSAYTDDVDIAADPEVSDSVRAALIDFVRFLAPADRSLPDDEVGRRLVGQGERIFAAVGCAACHVPSMTTGRSAVAALDRKRIDLYSDLLLHDLGAGLANVCSGTASPTEMRTAPLMALRHRRNLLHDGRTHIIEDAIRMHGGEAVGARNRFDRLTELERHALLAFLATL